MKCLSIRQPEASLIMLAVKRIENRSWPAPTWLIGQRIAIHASAGPLSIRSWSEIVTGASIADDEGVAVAGIALPPLFTLPRGVILGTAEVTDCRLFAALTKRLQRNPFAERGCYCWLLANPLPLAHPYACKGALRLWDLPVELMLA
jgi:hypothetical protein